MTAKKRIISFLIKDTRYARILNFEFLMNFIKCETHIMRFIDYNKIRYSEKVDAENTSKCREM